MRSSRRVGLSLALVLAALGCSGKSSSTFTGHPNAGGSGASSGTGATGESGATESGGSGGRGGSAGAGGSSGASAGGSGSGGMAWGGDASGEGGAPSTDAGGTASGGESARAGAAGAAGEPADADLRGNWGMFAFEDPVAVRLAQNEETLSGTGCCAGLDSDGLLSCCGPIMGALAGRQASFAFTFGSGQLHTYGTNVVVSEDGLRMGGDFSVDGHVGSKVAWVPLAGPNLGAAPPELRATLVDRDGHYSLLLVSQFVGRFEPLEAYDLMLSELGYVAGDLGPFYWGEMSWDAATQTLKAGPVSATDPSFAAELKLQFDGNVLTTIIATYPNDPPYFFEATRSE